jgi:hypothetical protein
MYETARLRIVERDVVADLLQVNFDLWCEARAHSLRAFFGHFGVLAFQTVKNLGRGFRFAAAATPFDFADRRLPPGDAADLLPEVAAHPE